MLDWQGPSGVPTHGGPISLESEGDRKAEGERYRQLRWTETATIHVQGQGRRAAREGAGGEEPHSEPRKLEGENLGNGWAGTAPRGPGSMEKDEVGKSYHICLRRVWVTLGKSSGRLMGCKADFEKLRRE